MTCGIATKNLGSDRLLEALLEDLPSPALRGAIHALGAEDADEDIAPEESGADARLRVQDHRRPLHRADQPPARRVRRAALGLARPERQRNGAKERVGQLSSPWGKEMDPVDELGPGDIGAVAKLKETRAGDVLAEKPTDIHFPPLDLPVARSWRSRTSRRSKGDEEKAATAIRRLEEEDPTLDVHRDPQTGEQIIAGLTQVHVEVIVDRMKRRFGAEIELHPAAGPVPGDDPQAGEGARPLQEADRRARSVRRLPHRDRAGRVRRRLRVRERDQGRRHPRRLHPRGREGDRGADAPRACSPGTRSRTCGCASTTASTTRSTRRRWRSRSPARWRSSRRPPRRTRTCSSRSSR